MFDHSKTSSLEACGLTNEIIKNRISAYENIGQLWDDIVKDDDELIKCVAYIIAIDYANKLSNLSDRDNIFMLIATQYIAAKVFNNEQGINLSQIVEMIYDFIKISIKANNHDVVKLLILTGLTNTGYVVPDTETPDKNEVN